MAEHSEAISTLNTLIATTIDSITGYEDSAQNIDNERFREIFRQRASERQQVVEQLRAEVRRLGGDPEDGGSFLGKAHQRFEDLKAAITGRDEKAIINEVERGEDYLKDKWQTALQSGELNRFRMTVIAAEVILGCLTCTGGLLAAGKLAEWIPTRPFTYKGQNVVSFLLLGAASSRAPSSSESSDSFSRHRSPLQPLMHAPSCLPALPS